MHTFSHMSLSSAGSPRIASSGETQAHPFYNENFVTLSFASNFGVRLIGGYNIPLAYRDLAENTSVYC